VNFASLTPEMIDGYVATGSPMDKAGGYGIQDGLASTFVRGINGCYFNVTGFPIHRFCAKMIEVIENKVLT